MIPDRLGPAEWLHRPAVQAIFAALDGREGRTCAVGGIVRDSLINRPGPLGDIDMATELLPLEVMQRAKAVGIGVHPTGIDHGTVTLHSNGTVVEVTTLRRDVVTDGRHAQVEFGTDWNADAARRDFTMNAIYCRADGTLFDPLGGAGDLINGRVRFIGEPATRIAEDALRVFRFFRFSASHGGEQFDPAGLAACAAAVGRLDHLSRERVGGEMMRMLALPKIARTLAVMREIKLFDWPEAVIQALLRYEAIGGQGAAARLALIAADDLDAYKVSWRLSNAVASNAESIALAAGSIADDQIARAAYHAGEAAVEGLAVAAAREGWRPDRLAEAARALARLPSSTLPISGKDLVAKGMKPGRQIGAAMAKAEALWIESEFTLDKAALLKAVLAD